MNMATKRKPGAVLGLPKKTIMTVKERRAKAGRPEIKFLDDPDRYLCAMIGATRAGNHVSKTRVAAIVAAIECGNEISPDSIAERADRAAAQKIVAACPPGKTPISFGPRISREDGTFVNTLSSVSTERFEARAKYLENQNSGGAKRQDGEALAHSHDRGLRRAFLRGHKGRVHARCASRRGRVCGPLFC